MCVFFPFFLDMDVKKNICMSITTNKLNEKKYLLCFTAIRIFLRAKEKEKHIIQVPPLMIEVPIIGNWSCDDAQIMI